MTASDFESTLKSINTFPVLGDTFQKDDFIPLDLSVSNRDLDDVNISDATDLQSYIWNHIKTNNAKVAYGGYIEKRGIYNRSTHFNKKNLETERNIHLGLDLWLEAGSPIYAPLEGEIHSFKNNINYGDYGPTLILKHRIKTVEFYTLYGHLSLESLDEKSIGENVRQGARIATLGATEINGEYPPHLHFQVIKTIKNYNGDFPGVTSLLDLEYFKENCPDPKLLMSF